MSKKDVVLRNLETLDWDYEAAKTSCLKWMAGMTGEKIDAILAEIKQERGD